MFTGAFDSRYEIACIVSIPHLGAAFKKCLVRTEDEAERELPCQSRGVLQRFSGRGS
jgi:hypothetical protein